MPKLPDVMDYGDRPSLRSNRVDPVHASGVELAEEISNAAQNFATMYGEHKQKDSRLAYALAKNEIEAAEIEQREALKDRDDFENFDEVYSTGFNSARDEILGRHGDRLSPRDRALLQSESDLIRERGRAVVGDAARGVERDLGRASIENMLTRRADEIQFQPPEKQNELMESALESVMAAVEDGWYTAEEGEKLLQGFVTAAATNSLKGMEAEQRLAEIELSLAWRERNAAQGGDAITREQAAADEGSGSIADFLPRHTLVALQEATQDEIEIENLQGEAFRVKDEAWVLFPGLHQGTERRAYIAEQLSGPDLAATRKEANTLDAQELQSRSNSESFKRAENSRTLTNELYRAWENDEDIQMDAGLLSTLTRPEQESLRKLQAQLREGAEWSDYTEWFAYEKWESMSDAERAAADLNGTFEDEYGNNIHWKVVVDRERANVMAQQKRQAERNQSGSDRPYSGLTQEQMLERYLINSPFFERKPTAADDKEIRDDWMRISLEFNRRLIEADEAGIDITPDFREKILRETLSNKVFVDEGYFDKKEEMFAVAVKPEEREFAYIPLDRKVRIMGVERTIYTPGIIDEKWGGHGSEKQSPYEFIKNQLQAFHPDNEEPSQRDIEEVWYYVVTDGWEAATNRMMGVEGY